MAKARAVRHGGGDGADPGVLGRTVLQPAAEDGGKTLPRGGHHTGLRIKGTHAVVTPRVSLGIGATLTLHRPDMDQDRALELPGPFQGVAEPGQIMAVHWAEVGEAHVLKEGAARVDAPLEEGLHPVVEAVDGILGRMLAEKAPVPLLEVVIGGAGAQTLQMLADGAHVGVDGHAVVVEDDDEGLAGGSGVVESLVGKAAGEGPVPDEGQDLVVLVPQRPGTGHAQGHGHRIGGVTGDEGVMDALPGLRKAGEAVQLTEGRKKLLPTGEGLVDIALVAYVEDQAVPLRIEAAVDSHGELHRPQVGGQVPPGL